MILRSYLIRVMIVTTLLAMIGTVAITTSNRPVAGMLNPAAVYCEALGYEYVIESTKEGQAGYCRLPNGQQVDAWAFLQGKVAQEYSYCQKNGYEIKTVEDCEKCFKFRLEECAVCVLKDGTEVEVTELMGLTFQPAPPFPRALLWGIISGVVVIILAGALAYWLIIRRRKTAAQRE